MSAANEELQRKLDRIEQLLVDLNRRLEFLDWCDCIERFGSRHASNQADGTHRCNRCKRTVRGDQ